MNSLELNPRIIEHASLGLRRQLIVAAGVAFSLITSSAGPATARIVHESDPRPTIAETLSGNIVVVGKLIEREPPSENGSPATLEVVETLRGGNLLPAPPTGGQLRIQLTLYGDEPVGSTFVVAGTKADELEWHARIVVQPTAIDYVRRTLVRPTDHVARGIALYADLGHADPQVADDVAEEFRRLSYKEMGETRATMPHDKLVRLIGDKDVSWRARYQYGRMLSLCGTADDLPALAAAIDNREDWARKALPDTVAAYMAIRGEAAVPWVTERLGKAVETDQMAMLSILEAVRRVESSTSAIPKARFPEIYRKVVKHPHFAYQVLLDLERHKDWDSLPLWLKLERDTAGTPNARMGKSAAMMFLMSCPLPAAKQKIAETQSAEPKFFKECQLEYATVHSAFVCELPRQPGDPRLPW